MNRGKKIVNCRENCIEKHIMSRTDKQETGPASNNSLLLADICHMIEETRSVVATAVNAGMTMLYWNIDKRINDRFSKVKGQSMGRKLSPRCGEN